MYEVQTLPREFNVPVLVEHSDEMCRICLEGEVTIAGAGEMKQILLDALASSKSLRIELDRVSELDVTAVQMLYALKRDATAAGVQFSLGGLLPEAISASLASSGLAKLLSY